MPLYGMLGIKKTRTYLKLSIIMIAVQSQTQSYRPRRMEQPCDEY